jgi:predicted RNase H-like HicB family nuclease
VKLKVLVRSEIAGGYSVSVPAFPGCHSQAETIAEALANIGEAIELWLDVMRKSLEDVEAGRTQPMRQAIQSLGKRK